MKNGRISIILAVTFLIALMGIGVANAGVTTLLQSGWENGEPSDGGLWQVWGTPVVVTSPVHSGTYAICFETSLGQQCYQQVYSSFVPKQSMQVVAWVYFHSLPTVDGNQIFLTWMYDSGGGCSVVSIVRNVGGVVYWGVVDNTAVSPISNVVVTSGVWHQIVLQGWSGSPFTYSVWIDGVQIVNHRSDGTYSSPYLNYAIVGGWHASESTELCFDDVNVSYEPFDNLVVPEYALGGLMATVACFAGLAVFKMRRRTPKFGLSFRE